MTIVRPLRAVAADLDKLRFPLLATPKLNGIRGMMIKGQLVSRNFKTIPNVRIRELLEPMLPDGVDGEIMCLEATLAETNSVVMSQDAPIDGVYFAAFDYVKDDPSKPYYKRMQDLKEARRSLRKHERMLVKGVFPIEVRTLQDFFETEESFVEAGHEGIMLRDPDGPYKFGRSTVREQILLKYKRFHDEEGVIVGFKEKQQNNNKKEADAFGLAKRSHKKAGKVGTNTLGAFRVRMQSGVEFDLGSGFTAKQRDFFWENRKQIKGKHVTFKYQEILESGKPQFPTFVSIRSDIY